MIGWSWFLSLKSSDRLPPALTRYKQLSSVKVIKLFFFFCGLKKLKLTFFKFPPSSWTNWWCNGKWGLEEVARWKQRNLLKRSPSSQLKTRGYSGCKSISWLQYCLQMREPASVEASPAMMISLIRTLRPGAPAPCHTAWLWCRACSSLPAQRSLPTTPTKVKFH